MARCRIKTSGGRLCPPQGYHWGGTVNAHARAVGKAMSGRKFSSGADARAAFAAASRSNKG